MNRLLSLFVLLIGTTLLCSGSAAAESYIWEGSYSYSCGSCVAPAICWQHTPQLTGNYTYYGSIDITAVKLSGYDSVKSRIARTSHGCGTWGATYEPASVVGSGADSGTTNGTCQDGISPSFQVVFYNGPHSTWDIDQEIQWALLVSDGTKHTVSGNYDCLDFVHLYVLNGSSWVLLGNDSTVPYSFEIYNNESYRLLFSNGAYHDFDCVGADIVFDYDACIWVYGYTCGIDTIKLRDAASQLIDTEYQDSGYDTYEMQGISSGNDYTISFYDRDSILCYAHAFTCTGEHVLVDYDRCNWVWPPSPWGTPIIIYLWAGYDYNIVVFKDSHGNFIENSQFAIYDKTDSQYLQRWTDAAEGYTLLGAQFDTDHAVQLMLRTFDGVFTLDTTCPANGSAMVGEENITTTNWTIPINYNLNVLPVDQSGAPLFDVFCGLSEYTPLNPGAFWGMDLSDQGYVSVTNCSGFSMCDIIAEKDGYADYSIEALNWTSKSALIKDYRHNIVMEADV